MMFPFYVLLAWYPILFIVVFMELLTVLREYLLCTARPLSTLEMPGPHVMCILPPQWIRCMYKVCGCELRL